MSIHNVDKMAEGIYSPVLVQNFEITDWISCDKGDENAVDKMILLARLGQTYEVPFQLYFWIRSNVSTFRFLTVTLRRLPLALLVGGSQKLVRR